MANSTSMVKLKLSLETEIKLQLVNGVWQMSIGDLVIGDKKLGELLKLLDQFIVD